MALPAGRYAARFMIADAPDEETGLGTAEIYDSTSGISLAQVGFRTSDREVVVPFTIAPSTRGESIAFRVARLGKHGFRVRSLALD